MGTMFVTRRDGTKGFRPRYMPVDRPQPLTRQDRQNIDALVEMYDETHSPTEQRSNVGEWYKRMQHITMATALRSLSSRGQSRVARLAWKRDVEWVKCDIGTPGLRLRDICESFDWDYDAVREELLQVAERARRGHIHRVPTLFKPRPLRLSA